MFRVSISLNEIVVLRWFAVYLLTPIRFFFIDTALNCGLPGSPYQCVLVRLASLVRLVSIKNKHLRPTLRQTNF